MPATKLDQCHRPVVAADPGRGPRAVVHSSRSLSTVDFPTRASRQAPQLARPRGGPLSGPPRRPACAGGGRACPSHGQAVRLAHQLEVGHEDRLHRRLRRRRLAQRPHGRSNSSSLDPPPPSPSLLSSPRGGAAPPPPPLPPAATVVEHVHVAVLFVCGGGGEAVEQSVSFSCGAADEHACRSTKSPRPPLSRRRGAADDDDAAAPKRALGRRRRARASAARASARGRRRRAACPGGRGGIHRRASATCGTRCQSLFISFGPSWVGISRSAGTFSRAHRRETMCVALRLGTSSRVGERRGCP